MWECLSSEILQPLQSEPHGEGADYMLAGARPGSSWAEPHGRARTAGTTSFTSAQQAEAPHCGHWCCLTSSRRAGPFQRRGVDARGSGPGLPSQTQGAGACGCSPHLPCMSRRRWGDPYRVERTHWTRDRGTGPEVAPRPCVGPAGRALRCHGPRPGGPPGCSLLRQAEALNGAASPTETSHQRQVLFRF